MRWIVEAGGGNGRRNSHILAIALRRLSNRRGGGVRRERFFRGGCGLTRNRVMNDYCLLRYGSRCLCDEEK